jgi:hypothetical protein
MWSYMTCGYDSRIKKITGANPTIVSYDASVVKICNATNSIPRLCIKNLLYFLI